MMMITISTDQKMSSLLLFESFLILIFLASASVSASASSVANPDGRFSNCSRLYSCGSLLGIGYPFWGRDRPSYCGRKGFQLDCIHGQYTKITPISDLTGSNKQIFRVLDILKGTNRLTLARDDLWNDTCPESFTNATLMQGNTISKKVIYVELSSAVAELNIYYGCSSGVAKENARSSFTCPRDDGVGSAAFYAYTVTASGVAGCDVGIVVPVRMGSLSSLRRGDLTLLEALRQGFDVLYYRDVTLCSLCEASGGRCGSRYDADSFLCFCPDGPSTLSCAGNRKNMLKLIIGGSAAGMGMVLIGLITYYFKKKGLLHEAVEIWKTKNRNDQDLEAFLKDYKSLAPKRYTYADVKKMTSSFKDELGQGGYGVVYQGKLPDGSLVAVKILKASSKGDGEDFINEVKSISKTSHVNIVKFLGFCLEGRKKALIYEFMPNGSLEKFIYGESSLGTGGHGQLGWDKLYQISVGIARGLEYLHRGCNTRILHFDIKPHNILLDEEFSPKISDFGLAKLCNQKESIISMVEARGTIGYIAPELISRIIGGVSHKSDVYSYGMMVLEMVGVRKNTTVDHSSEKYFPHWVFKRLEQDDLGFQAKPTNEENEMVRKMITVGLWCIQADPSQRPSMGEVLKMLEGPVEALQIPSNPTLRSPPKSPAISSTESIIPCSSALNSSFGIHSLGHHN